jgi:hypothetical protein
LKTVLHGNEVLITKRAQFECCGEEFFHHLFIHQESPEGLLTVD